ncbi:putative protein phosphatase 2C 38 [Sesamum angolense]|uniref:protein-serine/threonine phosphatase n=1 Tax=Sesamum angolense TaxID=2727404 RepID=A0AAE2BNT8_9LAMI|nr:putative protein phosphatase 2C 38 [Sesamum angolense]
MVKPCWRPLVDDDGTRRGRDGSRRGGDTKGRFDGLLWHKDLGHHVDGEFSMAVIQANNLLEDYSQLESGPLSLLDSGPCGTFIGVYDGHGGPETSRFVNQTLFANLKKFASEHKEISANVIKKAFLATEEEFLSVVRQKWHIMHKLLQWERAVWEDKAVGAVTAIQLSTEHNANIESVRDELRTLHPNDSRIVVLKHKVWRVKGIIQVSRSIGDAYLKRSEFNKEPLLQKFRLSEPFSKPILSAEPSIFVHRLNPRDQFLIFASDGLWEHLTNQEAVDIVNSYPRRVSLLEYARKSNLTQGIARRLVKAALRVAAKRENAVLGLEENRARREAAFP